MDIARYFHELSWNLFNESLDVHVILDVEHNRFVMCNKNVYNIYGYTQNEFLKITPYDLSVEFKDFNQMEYKQETIINKGFDKFITKHKTKNGEILDIYVKSKKIDIENANLLFITLSSIQDEPLLEKYYKNKSVAKHIEYKSIQNIYQWDSYTKTLLKNNTIIELSKSEKELLSILIKNINSPVSKENIIEYLDKQMSDNSLLSMVKRVRKKTTNDFIKNIYSKGYQIDLYR